MGMLLASIFQDSLVPGPDFGTRLKISCDSRVTNWARTDLIGIPAFQNETSSGPRNLARVARPLLACVWSGAETNAVSCHCPSIMYQLGIISLIRVTA